MATIDFGLLRPMLLRVEKPARYAGGEFGSLVKEGCLTVALSYPDLYEIGMSNNAVRILYGLLNKIDGVRCERVFAPAADMERELRRARLPLFSLESRLPLAAFDFIAFSVGYELNAANVLQILDCGGVPLRRERRTEAHPLVIGGGPGLTNPAPFLGFFDFIYIGEAEGWIETAFRRLAALKQSGAPRRELAAFLAEEESVVSSEKPSARRAVWTGFGAVETGGIFPVASLKTAQDHGVVEIMRGCPNGCRFCNAGYTYRPFRIMPPSSVILQAARLVFAFGYREISLSSLSTGDYPLIGDLLRLCNRELAHIGTSFSLPSLKIDSLALGLFREIKTVRKSGLTFAIETPFAAAQRTVNKQVPIEKTIALLREAKSLGWKQAKFYFMLGLPGYIEEDETSGIIDCLERISRAGGLPVHVNLSTFVPKPHTPFQWCAQLSAEEARKRIGFLISRLSRRFFKITFHDPFQSFLEGLIARGDERVGDLIEKAYTAGARFDAWEEHVNKDLWKRTFEGAGWDVAREVYRARHYDEPLPWRMVDIGVKNAALRREAERARLHELTSPCMPDCMTPCGACGGERKAGAMCIDSGQADEAVVFPPQVEESRKIVLRNETYRVLFAFSKRDEASLLSHLNVISVFERAFLRAGYYCRMTEGFNPKPVIEFADPLPLGFESIFETAVVELYHFDNDAEFRIRLNRALPRGFSVVRAQLIPAWKTGEKKISLMSGFWGGDYRVLYEQMPDLSRIMGLEEVKKVHICEANRQLVIRYGGTGRKERSFRKCLEKLFDSSDYLSYCRPIRIMTLGINQKGIPQNYFRFFH